MKAKNSSNLFMAADLPPSIPAQTDLRRSRSLAKSESVKFRKCRTLEQLNVKTSAESVQYAIKLGLVSV